MAQRFDQLLSLDAILNSDIKIPAKSSDTMPPTVRVLQPIFIAPPVNEKVFKLLEEKIYSSKKKPDVNGCIYCIFGYWQ